MLEFAKVFDKVSHAKLVQKLEAYGMNTMYVNGIKSLLIDRRQRVLVQDNSSEWLDVTCSVPQGSILGLLLITIFMNEMLGIVFNECSLYSDDSKLIGVID